MGICHGLWFEGKLMGSSKAHFCNLQVRLQIFSWLSLRKRKIFSNILGFYSRAQVHYWFVQKNRHKKISCYIHTVPLKTLWEGGGGLHKRKKPKLATASIDKSPTPSCRLSVCYLWRTTPLLRGPRVLIMRLLCITRYLCIIGGAGRKPAVQLYTASWPSVLLYIFLLYASHYSCCTLFKL